MRVSLLCAENFKLDGGACFGVVPKSMWNKLFTADENNMLDISLRELLVEDGNRLILFDTGIGNKQNEKFRKNFYVADNDSLLNSFKTAGISPDRVTDVVFTHLHFDHCGGTFRIGEQNETIELFKNARYWCSKAQWNWATNPNPREKASYLTENLQPLMDSGRLNFFENEGNFTPNIYITLKNGHTDGQVIPLVKYRNRMLAYMADFIPTAAHISLPFVASFDTRPLLSIDEKKSFLDEAAQQNYLLVFQHDIANECCTVMQTEKGVRVNETGTLEHFMNEI